MQGRIGYINIHVSDVERAVAFYRDVLGFQLESSDPAFSYARFNVDGFHFAVAGGGTPKSEDAPILERLTGVGIVVPDVDAAFADMKAKGARFTMEPSRQPWGGYMAMFADPDGNVFYLDAAQ